ncbi:ZIP family metal transporter [Peredibacter sp. HCB2-198]|uniref:ZIP family metal transporter n=1 Tax=Peredibacter sp. HCB2-198 TaxID=3383025 RepID=UPI0038B64166
MSILLLAFIGGIVSAVSTSVGSLLAPLFSKFETLRKYHMSMDFALGVMLSAVAFSLVGPELMKGHHLKLIFSGLVSGGLFILFTHKLISYFNRDEKYNSYKTLLVAALIFHNLPEGMGAGASLAGMNLNEAIPLQMAISIQNVAEGLLLTMLLQGLGLSLFWSVLGGIISGLIEMSGAVFAGFLLQDTVTLLPFLLALAGGAMMMSVLLEVHESISLGKHLKAKDFLGGMLVIPLTNFLMG